MSVDLKSASSAEAIALKVSIGGALFMACLGFGFAALTKSEAIFLDGFFSLINMSMGFITLKVSKLVTAGATLNFQYGKAQVEPLLNTVKSLLFIAVISIACISAVNTLLDGGKALSFDWAILYALTATIGCFAIGKFINSKNQNHPTPLLEVEGKSWLIDGVLSGVVMLAFISGYLLTRTQYSNYTSYIDPALLVVMSLLLIPVPIKILKDNIMELLLIAPEESLQKSLYQIVGSVLTSEPIDSFDLRFVKTGRFVMCDIIVLVDNKDSYLLADFDQVREHIIKQISTQHPEVDILIETTADEAYYLRQMTK